MRIEVKKFLYDIRSAAKLVREFTNQKTFADYEADVMLRSAVERLLSIIGEAVSQIAKLDRSVTARIGG